jgi:ribosomal protein S11
MQEKKYLNRKNSYKKNKNLKTFTKKINKFKFIKGLNFYRKILKSKVYSRSNFFSIDNKRTFSHKLSIVVTANNIFCSLIGCRKNQTLKSCSSGKYKIKTSKKKLKHTFDLVISNFIAEINKKYKYRGIIINITSPIKIRKKIINTVSFNFKKIPLLIKVFKKKSFNGCRPPKQIRKKRRGMKIFK